MDVLKEGTIWILSSENTAIIFVYEQNLIEALPKKNNLLKRYLFDYQYLYFKYVCWNGVSHEIMYFEPYFASIPIITLAAAFQNSIWSCDKKVMHKPDD